MKQLAIIGSGGFAREIFRISTSLGHDVIGFIDEQKKSLLPRKIIGHERDMEALIAEHGNFAIFIAIGNATLRSTVEANIPQTIEKPVLLHNSANVYSDSIGQGSVIYPQSVIMTDCSIGKNCLINSGVTVGHDSIIGDFCNINPGVNIAGRVNIGSKTTIGIGACIRENISIGEGVTVGAGAVVVQNIPDHSICYGNPARAQND